ncbi:MAG: C10 family peptidase [Krumholzibacteria bacterium]|nr:C10 family peptidase [Candidatus Krumholzibacteria bacterium]
MSAIKHKAIRGPAAALLVACLGSWLIAAPAAAEKLTADQVAAAVTTWVRLVSPARQPDAAVKLVEPYPATGPAAAYIVHLAGDGYCLAGADDRLLPVTRHQPRGAYDPRNPDSIYVLGDYAARMAKIEDAEATKSPELALYAAILAGHKEDWSALVQGRRPLNLGQVSIAAVPQAFTLPLTSTWDQGSPYNDDCPVLTPGSDEHVVVGCVATAAAQIMRYWESPYRGTGSTSSVYHRRYRDEWISTPLWGYVEIPPEFANRLEWVPDNGGELHMRGYWDFSLVSAASRIDYWMSFQDALWDLWGRLYVDDIPLEVDHAAWVPFWELMEDVHTDPASSYGDTEVARLSWQFAVATYMDFGVRFSGAFHPAAVRAYTEHFFYDPDAENLDNTQPLDAAIVNDLLWLRPVQLAGTALDGGRHSWVVIGYDVTTSPTSYLMNYGWGGAPVWTLRDEAFPDDQELIINIAPAEDYRFVASGSIGGDGSPGQPYANLAAAAAAAADGTTLIFRTGSDATFPGTSVTIDRPMVLKGVDVSIRPQ